MKYYYTFLVINFIFSGLMLALWFFIAPPGMSVSNGVLYFNISTKTLIISIIASYIVIHIFSIMSKKVPITVSNYLSTIYIDQKQITLKGFVDTGNFLQDIFSATPVVICKFKAIESILPTEIKEIAINKKISKNLNISKFHIRFIPYQTIDNENFIVALRPDKFILTSSSARFEIPDVYIGLALDENLFSKEFDIILNPKLLK